MKAIILAIMIGGGVMTASLLVNKENPMLKEYNDIRQIHAQAKYKGHVQTVAICSRSNNYATVLLNDGNYFGATWDVVEKDSIPDLIRYEVCLEDSVLIYLHKLGLEFDWIANPKEERVGGGK